jgi:hypothetical protein
MSRRISRALALAIALLCWSGSAYAQGVTTAAMQGVVKDDQGQVIPGVTVTATHAPSGTVYEAVTQADGRFTIPGMRVGGPYAASAALTGFTTAVQNNLTLSLGVTQNLEFTLKVASISETITVVGTSDPVFSSSHTGAATAVMREDLASLPTISGRITDITRLTPQYGGSGTFAGQDNRANNMTVDGSYFNNSFGLGVTTGGIGDRTGVAPISLEAIEQVQVNVAPYDVRQGSFTGAGVNTVTRSGTNSFTASTYYRTRNEDCSDLTNVDTCSGFVGTTTAGQRFNPLNFKTKTAGVWAGGPIVKNKLFAFGAYEKQEDRRPLITFNSNPGGAPVAGNTTRVLASDLSALSSFLSTNFKYDTGPFDNVQKVTPAKPWMLKADYNLNSANKVTFRYNQLDSRSPVLQNGSSALGTLTRQTNTTNWLSFQSSNYAILENLKSGVGEWNSVFGTFTNNLLVGYTKQDESRDSIQLFPYVVISDGSGSPYTSFGSEPFTPFNLLRYGTFQLQDSVTKFARNHSLTFGGTVEKFHSDNSFYFGIQSAYAYNSLADFYTDANGFLANPNRTVSPVNLLGFQVKYLLQPGQTTPPMQPLDVIYAGGYIQDEWRPSSSLTVTAGLRVDVPRFGNTAFDNPAADALTFRDQDGSPVKYNSGRLPETTPYWSPRVGFNYDLTNDQKTQLRGGTGLFSGKPPYVWISNQIGNTGVLYGFADTRNTTAFPFNPNPDKYKPAATGGSAASYELNVTDDSFRFPQTWRTNVGVDRKLPWGLVGTLDYIYNRDVNAPVYLNANLPVAEGAYTGADKRPRWAITAPGATPAPGISVALPDCAALGQVGACYRRLNNAPGNQVTAAYVIKNQSENNSWNISGALTKNLSNGFSFKGGFNYGVSRSLVEPSSTAGTSWGGANPIVFDPNNPDLAYSANSPGKRVFVAANYTRQYFGFGATTISVFYDGHTNGNTSYVFAGDANNEGVSGNDLIYIPRNTSEMNFKPLSVTVAGVTRSYTAADQAAAFEQLIVADKYLSSHRGGYAERNGVFLPIVNRVDLNLTQDVFHSVKGRRHSGQVRLDITNFGNLLNDKWGAGRRLVNTQILTAPTADATGALTYNLQTLSGNLITSPLQTSAGINDVYVMMLSFRYTFQ